MLLRLHCCTSIVYDCIIILPSSTHHVLLLYYWCITSILLLYLYCITVLLPIISVVVILHECRIVALLYGITTLQVYLCSTNCTTSLLLLYGCPANPQARIGVFMMFRADAF